MDEHALSDDPIAQLRRWLDDAAGAGVPEPTAMSLATVMADGRPASRMVLLKGADARGLVFFTHYTSRKGRELDGNPAVAACFFWPQLARQVRVEGRVSRVSAEESDAYFASRPYGSRIGAHVSEQSETLADRATLEARFAALSARFPEGAVPRPPHWGGYLVTPSAMEFWQGRESRLHDRIVYERGGAGWTRRRLWP